MVGLHFVCVECLCFCVVSFAGCRGLLLVVDCLLWLLIKGFMLGLVWCCCYLVCFGLGLL